MAMHASIPLLDQKDTAGTNPNKTRPDGNETTNTRSHLGEVIAPTSNIPFRLPPRRVDNPRSPKDSAMRDEAS